MKYFKSTSEYEKKGYKNVIRKCKKCGLHHRTTSKSHSSNTICFKCADSIKPCGSIEMMPSYD